MSLASCAVVVVGSLHHDIVVKAPARPRKGETVTGDRWYPKFGGKGGNQAVAASSSGVEVRFVGAVGRDEMATYMLDHLDRCDIDTRFVAKSKTLKTGMSVAIIDGEGDYGAVIVSGANTGIEVEQLEPPAIWDGAKILVLQNEIPEATNILAATEARSKGMRVCLNAAPSRTLSKQFADLIDVLVVNAIEAEDICGIQVNSLAMAQIAATELAQLVPIAVVTAGGDGVAVALRDGESFALEAQPVELVSTHGAGDVFVGSLAAELAKGSGIRLATERANLAASKHVSKREMSESISDEASTG